ncbi:MAG: hypothetical protein HC800_01390 [Phormidesmis sp. RL_2_1]|nr:hypothetical protein [Phormidesmis sp. RL_2_1]
MRTIVILLGEATPTLEALSSSGETLRRFAALRNAHQDEVRMHPYFAIPVVSSRLPKSSGIGSRL